MLVKQAYRYELNPNNKQRTLLAKHAGCARFAYNWGLARRMEEYKTGGKSSSGIEQHRQLNALKRSKFPWMYEVSKCAPQEALRDLDKAYQNFFREISKGNKVGFPRFKKKGIHDSFRLTGSIYVFDRAVQLPRIGVLRTKEGTRVKGRILSGTVSRDADRWYISLGVEREREVLENTSEVAVGIDLGLESFATLSSGEKLSNQRYLKDSLQMLKRRSKQHSRKQKGSSNRKRSAIKLSCLYRRIKNQRRDFLHKLSSELAKTKSVIVMEGLSVRNMVRNKHLSRAISDVGWGTFKQMLEYKSLWYGSRLVTADKFYPSSRLCSQCGCLKDDLKLSERVYYCCECGLETDRDLNSALNLLKLATASSAGSNACGDGRLQVNLVVNQCSSLKQEVNPVRELRSLTVHADGGFIPPSASIGDNRRLNSAAFSNGVNTIEALS